MRKIFVGSILPAKKEKANFFDESWL